MVGVSGAGKTALVRALAKTGNFTTAYEQHADRPFQVLAKQNPKFTFPNQLDYLLLRAEQEKELRAASQIGLMDGGLDLDFHGFTRLFHSRGLLSDPEFDLCRRLYTCIREFLPMPELIVRLCADEVTVAGRLSGRKRINIASADDTASLNSFLDEWLAGVSASQILELDVASETLEYNQSVQIILRRLFQIS